MNSRLRLEIGSSSYSRLKKTSPFATLLLDVASALTEEDVSQIRLAVVVDKHASKRVRCTLKNAADIMLFLYEKELICASDTYYIEQLLTSIGRKDVICMINKYHQHRENKEVRQPCTETTVKTVFSGYGKTNRQFTHLKPRRHTSTETVMSNGSQNMLLKEAWRAGQADIHGDRANNQAGSLGHPVAASCSYPMPQQPSQTGPSIVSHSRTGPDGMSSVDMVGEENKPPSPEEDCFGSQMSVDSSQPWASQMSISDDEKVSFLIEKVWPHDTDDTSMCG